MHAAFVLLVNEKRRKMKRKTGKIAIVSFLVFNIILQIIYQFVIRTKIPYDWWYIYGDVHYPQKIADHFADCFFFMNYFLVGYLVFEEKHYYDGMKDGRLANKWRYGAQVCQIGGLAAYAILWLGLTDDPFLRPVDTPDSYIYMLFFEKMSEEQWDNSIGYIYCVYAAIILAPAFLFYVLYFVQFIKMYIRRKKAGCPDKKWNRWNIIYITVFLLIFFWSFESLRGFDLVGKIPGFSSFLREYYRRHPPSVPPTWVS